MTPLQPAEIHSTQLLQKYDVFFFDAYGVLVNSSGSVPGAAQFLQALKRHGKTALVLTNDASRTQAVASAFYRRCGLDLPAENVVTAGMAIQAQLQQLLAADGSTKSLVLGTSDTAEMVRAAGQTVVAIQPHADFDTLVIGDDSGFDFLVTLNTTLTALHRLILGGKTPRLLLGNSDLLYPKGPDSFGFTSGAIAQMLESALRLLHPSLDLRFQVLGKPSNEIFELAWQRAASLEPGLKRDRVVMIGDQLHTDIRGANQFGIDSALIATGITQLPLPEGLPAELRPRYILQNL